MLRNIPFQFDRTIDSGRQSVGHCPEGCLSSVLEWFCEPSKLTEGVGYPTGTLLWYHVPAWITPDGEVRYPSTVRVDWESGPDAEAF